MLNPHLVKAPKECIDYVILYELCHIAEHNYSERFWRLLTQVMPNLKDVKAKLNSMAEMYLNETFDCPHCDETLRYEVDEGIYLWCSTYDS
ncbi:hypothetical protein CWB58_12635 [Pseudoalteromonas sp. S201]|uniref:YgjP-like metallopeptidase domain-containing protein n=1 Tax=Pseudoalteromonas sp. S201 TaxID=579519 RepID=UPI00110CAA22|nr:YgjP-like metallopeptidase domain-containing protein [Pseudoalteromonas sp. S201]TMS92763.1 hypothetical protein CWB58_12635 [Pseudoalteromonas sp. S201]